jgi:hypothetical protein
MSVRALLVLAVALAAFELGCSAKSDVPKATFESKLTDVDRKAAMAQKVCPVTEERLFSMGTPIKVTAEGRQFFICCASCEDDAASDFDAYFAKTEVKPKTPTSN